MQPENAAAASLGVRFWGVRGSIPTPIHANMGHGGNTACVQIVVPGEETFLLDAGSGIHNLGRALHSHPEAPGTFHIFLSHFHWDHLQGLPGFAPLFSANGAFNFYAARPTAELKQILHGQMIAPYFPVDFEALASTRKFVEIASSGLTFGDLSVMPFELNHPGGSTGYRVSRDGAVIVYATDHEHGNPSADERLQQAAEGADILIYDAQYTPEQYPKHVGWGHSTWEQGVKLAKAAGVKQLVLFHHDPHHDDHALQRMRDDAMEHFPNTLVAAEGITLTA